MARYEHLGTFKTSKDLTNEVLFRMTHFKREYKYTVGMQLRDSCLKIVKLIVMANENSGLERIRILDETKSEVASVKVLIDFLGTVQAFKNTVMVELIRKIVSLEKQLSGWSNHTKQEFTSKAS